MKSLIEIAEALDITGYLDARDVLLQLYREAKAHLSHWSWIRMSEELGFGKTNVLHLMAQGKRSLTVKAADRIADSLKWKGTKRQFWLTLATWQSETDPIHRETLFRKLYSMRERSSEGHLSPDAFEYFDCWYHPVVRELVALSEFQSDPTWIAESLEPKIRVDEARKSLELLERLGMIRFDSEKNRHVLTQTRVATDLQVDSMSVVRYHQRMIDHGKDAITNIQETLRDISAITFNGDAVLAEKVKGELDALRLRLLSYSEKSTNGDQIWQLNMQFFPMSSRVKSSKKGRD